MKRFLSFVIVIVIVGCRSPDRHAQPKDDDDISQVICAIVDDKQNFLKDSLPLSIDLKKIRVSTPPRDSTEQGPVIPMKWVLKNEEGKGFKAIDTPYILLQNDKIKKFRLSKDLIYHFKLITNYPRKRVRENSLFYEFSIPIFSADRKKAYVEMDKYCDMCGKGYTFYLEKGSDGWKVIWWDLRWIS